MAANLVGSVTAGFGAVLLGTALARGLTEPAIERSAVDPRGVATRVVGLLHPARGGGGEPLSVREDAFRRDADHKDTDDGSQR